MDTTVEMGSRLLKKYTLISMLLWTAGVGALFILEAVHFRTANKALAIAEARTQYQKDQATRLWAAAHGGVYVPATEKTPPNPFLSQIAERDVITPGGKHLTLMNPAYMLRQMMDFYTRQYGTPSHIISLKYRRPETAPDGWEKEALQAFDKGSKEVMAVSDIEGAPYLRLIRPLLTEAQCLKCHADQGYKVGDVRGGVSVSVPLKPYWDAWSNEVRRSVTSLGIVWLTGLAGLNFFRKRISSALQEREKAEASLRISQENYKILADNSLTGIYVSQNGLIVYANAEFARIHGYALNEVIGMQEIAFIHNEDRQAAMERLSLPCRGRGAASTEFQIRCLTKSAATIWVQRRIARTNYNGLPAILGNEIDITLRMLADAELVNSERQLQRLADGLIEVREIERNRLARDIHENIAQRLGAIKLRIESMLADAYRPLSPEACNSLDTLVTQIQQTIGNVRSLARELSPLGLEYVGLKKTLGWLCDQFSAKCPGIHIQRAFHINEEEIPDPLKMVIFRIAEQSFYTIAGRCDLTLQIGLELIAERIVFYMKTDQDSPDADDLPAEGRLSEDLAFIALERLTRKFGGTLAVSASQGKGLVLIASWDYPMDECARTAPPVIENRGPVPGG